MKKLLGLFVFVLLLNGCTTSKPPQREHLILCTDVKSQEITYNIVVPNNVDAFVIKGQPVLAYWDTEGNCHIIRLAKNDCFIY